MFFKNIVENAGGGMHTPHLPPSGFAPASDIAPKCVTSGEPSPRLNKRPGNTAPKKYGSGGEPLVTMCPI